MGVLWNFFLTSLLLTNAVCILHEKRFLKPCTHCCCSYCSLSCCCCVERDAFRDDTKQNAVERSVRWR